MNHYMLVFRNGSTIYVSAPFNVVEYVAAAAKQLAAQNAPLSFASDGGQLLIRPDELVLVAKTSAPSADGPQGKRALSGPVKVTLTGG